MKKCIFGITMGGAGLLVFGVLIVIINGGFDSSSKVIEDNQKSLFVIGASLLLIGCFCNHAKKKCEQGGDTLDLQGGVRAMPTLDVPPLTILVRP